MARARSVLVIACGALAREVMALIRANGWDFMEVQCLPAELHNRPGRIPGAVRAKIEAARGSFERIFVAYGDCGTGGELDRVLAEAGAERIPGAHCYEFYAGTAAFVELAEAEAGTFYLTDFLVRHFERLVIRGLGIDRHPELQALYFGNYRRLVYLSQVDDEALDARARDAARRLGLAYHRYRTGYGGLQQAMAAEAARVHAWPG